MDGVRRRSDEAFAAVHRVVASDLVSYARGMLRDRHEAEDAVQQAFVDLVRAAHRVRGDGRALLAWLYRTTRRRCLDELRRRSRHPEVPVVEVPESHAESPDAELEDALARMAPRDREMIVLRHVVGLSGEEMARVSGRSRAAVYASVERAEKRLRALLEEAT